SENALLLTRGGTEEPIPALHRGVDMSVYLLPLHDGELVEVPEGLTLIGRDGDCDVQLAWAFVSKMHCVLANMDGCLLVRDLGSPNGTRVNGVRVRSARLRHQDKLCVGEMAFLVAIGCERPPDRARRGKGARTDQASLSGV